VIRVRRDPYSYLLRVASVAELLMLLEVISFFTESNDLSARFSISGTIFLAMVRRADWFWLVFVFRSSIWHMSCEIYHWLDLH
jgi:hypothetical protein